MRKQAKEFKEKTVKELEKQLILLNEELSKFRLTEKAAPAKDSNLQAKKRKQLAVLLTVLNEKKEVENLQAKKI